MRWLADENMHAGVVKALRQHGHDVTYAAEVLQQDSDHALLARAVAEGRLLLTEDKDFGEIVFREGHRMSERSLYCRDDKRWCFRYSRSL